ncbi:MAG: amidase [Thermomicrobiales bacterium]
MTAHELQSIAQLGRMIRSGEVSPVELAESAIERLESTGRELNAIAATTADLAFAQARAAEEELSHSIDRGPLHGIPYGAKDLLATRGIPTSWGMAPFRDRVIDEDAAVVTSLREAGAVLTAKLAMVEGAGGFGYEQPDAAFTGPGKSALDPQAWSGGSSSGSGSAVGSGCVPFAIGTETWGSIHIPSAFNGLTGFRPTYGLVSKHGAMALSWTMDKIGPLCLTAEDCGLVLAAIADGDSQGRRGRRGWFEPPHPATGTMKIAVLKNAAESAQAEVGAAFQGSLELLETFASLEEVDLPEMPWEDVARVVILVEGASAFEEFLLAGRAAELTAPEDRTGLLEGLTVPAVDYLRTMRIRHIGMRQVDELLSRFDAIVAPASPFVAPPIDQNFKESFSRYSGPSLGAAGNLCGLPSISLPIGVGEQGLPASLEIMGRAWDDAKVIAIAMRYQNEIGWSPGGGTR